MKNSCLLILLIVVSLVSLPPAAAETPNIVLMMADDMGVGDTSAYQDWTGNPDDKQVQTPNMERLARLGVRFTDAHSPSSRCTATRYALLTGRYCWRTRLKYSVLFGPQGDPLIEPDRPTLATLLKSAGYRTGMTGKWHVGLTYRDGSGAPAASYAEADLRRGIADGPLDHGFDFFHGTSRSHPTSAAQGWLAGDQVPAATGPQAVDPSKYVLAQTGVKNFQAARQFLTEHMAGKESRQQPFFLYYACHSNHTRHTPCKQLAGIPVAGQGRPAGRRSDFIYENDVVLGQLLKFLETEQDPRRPGSMLMENTLVIFTSDNGAENTSKTATGPVRSNKGSVYEGGHRIPLIVAWQQGGVGDADSSTPGRTSRFPVGLVDLFASFAELVDVAAGKTGGEDSHSVLPVLRGEEPAGRPPLVHHDHKQGGDGGARDPRAAWLAIRVDNPVVDEVTIPGQWKLLVDDGLLREGKVQPRELYELKSDLAEMTNRIQEPALAPLVKQLSEQIKQIHDDGRIH
jgi:arylsulfatase A-like enzyme